MTPVDVRRAVPAEATAVSRVLAEAIRASYTGLLEEAVLLRLIGDQCSLPRIRAEIGIPGGTPGWLGWLVATTADGTVVGAVAGGVPSSGSGEVYSLCTAPSHRRGKIGSALLSAATDQQKQHEARQQAISLHSPDDPLLPFLRHHGFRLQEPASGREDTLRCLRTL